MFPKPINTFYVRDRSRNKLKISKEFFLFLDSVCFHIDFCVCAVVTGQLAERAAADNGAG